MTRYTAPLRYRTTALKTFGVIRTVFSRYTAPYTIPYYCAQDYGIIRLICGRKIAVFSSFSVRKRPVNDAVLIDLGSDSSIKNLGTLRRFDHVGVKAVFFWQATTVSVQTCESMSCYYLSIDGFNQHLRQQLSKWKNIFLEYKKFDENFV